MAALNFRHVARSLIASTMSQSYGGQFAATTEIVTLAAVRGDSCIFVLKKNKVENWNSNAVSTPSWSYPDGLTIAETSG